MISQLKYDLINYESVKIEAKKIYCSFGPVKCQALGGRQVHFTAEGFNHILYKYNHERSKEDQFMRLKIIDLAKKIIGLTTTTQEKDEGIKMISCKINKKKKQESKIIKYWAFSAIIENKKIKTIIRQIGDGNIHFWSVIPDWTTTKTGNVVFMDYSKSDLEND